jgi:rhodanese-related sulfurtransferase
MTALKNMFFIGLFIVSIFLFSGCITNNEDQREKEISEPILLDINPQEAYELIQNNTNNPDFIILDVRTLEEYHSGHLSNAIVIDYYNETFRTELDELYKEKTYLIYCRTGRRTGDTINIMEELGFQSVYNMLGGITQWELLGLPIENK